VVVMKVAQDYQHLNKTIEEAGLRHLKGLFLFQIQRDNQVITPAAPDEKIIMNDRLFFTGLPETIMEIQRVPGLSLLKDAVFNLKNHDSDDVGTFEVVISSNSPLIGKNVRDSNFRSVYDAVIVAIHRSGERVRQKIGDIVMHAGDTMLIAAKRSFIERWYNSRDFYLVSRSVEVLSKPPPVFLFFFWGIDCDDSGDGQRCGSNRGGCKYRCSYAVGFPLYLSPGRPKQHRVECLAYYRFHFRYFQGHG
jgi:Trk K+ transport system NAD-binding subunit